jgi:uroporphyrinogen decarboxylase
MTPRERVKKVLNHKIPDRVPIDFGSISASSIMVIAYNKLREKLGINNSIPHMYSIPMQLAYPEMEVIERFHVDIIDAGQNFLKLNTDWREWTLNDGSKCLVPNYINLDMKPDGTVFLYDKNDFQVGIKPSSSLYVDQSFWPYRELPAIPATFKDEDLIKYSWAAAPQPPWYLNIWDDKAFEIFVNGIKEIHDNTDYAIMLFVGCNLFEVGTFLRGMENFLCDFYIDKKGTKRLLDKLTEGYLKTLERIIKPISPYVDVVEFGDDLGGTDGPFMSLDVYRDILQPRHAKTVGYIHDNSDIKVLLHSCGSIYELLPGIIDAGFDIINPVQTVAKDMEPKKLKKEFGEDLIFWGGCCDTRDILPRGSVTDVEEEVKRNIEILGEDGGLVFNQVHNIMADVPPENVIAMFDAAFKYGKY